MSVIPPHPGAVAFYRRAMETLQNAGVPFMVGGAYALAHHTGVERHTKDLDLFLRRQDLDRALAALREAGYRTEVTYPHWLAKAFHDDHFIDLIFNLGNGAGPVDDGWLGHAVDGRAMGMPAKLCGPEEMVFSKIFTLDRGRYDGADVAHVLRACSDRMDWDYLLERTGSYWRVLLSHLVLFGFIYPGEQDRIPARVMGELLRRLRAESKHPPAEEALCQGTLLSPTQYQIDVERWGYEDARLEPRGGLTPEQLTVWEEGLAEGK